MVAMDPYSRVVVLVVTVRASDADADVEGGGRTADQ
jgi:hypothetical protein